jgi:hypothetical protein
MVCVIALTGAKRRTIAREPLERVDIERRHFDRDDDRALIDDQRFGEQHLTRP